MDRLIRLSRLYRSDKIRLDRQIDREVDEERCRRIGKEVHA